MLSGTVFASLKLQGLCGEETVNHKQRTNVVKINRGQMLLKKAVIVVAGALGLILSVQVTPVFAATDGTLGTTSTGTSVITVTIPELILITGLADISFGTYGGTGDLNGNDDICIYTNKAAGTYGVTATGDGAASAFTITDGSNTIAYNVYFNDVSGTTGETQLITNTANTSQTGANTSSQNCGGGANANFHVEMLEANLQAAPAGAYSGTLTLVVAPQ